MATTEINLLTRLDRPGLHVWRAGTPLRLHLTPTRVDAATGWATFVVDLDDRIATPPRFTLFAWEGGHPGTYEPADHQRALPLGPGQALPAAVWAYEGSARTVLTRPGAGPDRVRLHLITARRYRDGRLFLWRPGTSGRLLDPTGEEEAGVAWDVALLADERRGVLWKFVEATGAFEPDHANRLWVGDDGDELWTHSGAPAAVDRRPTTRTLTLHVHQRRRGARPPTVHLWQAASDFVVDVPTSPAGGDWSTGQVDLYERLPYRFMLRDDDLDGRRWEDEDARREVEITGDAVRWVVEGDPKVFDGPVAADREVVLEVAVVAPWLPTDGPLTADVRVHRARDPLLEDLVPAADGRTFRFATFPDVVTVVELRTGPGAPVSRHEVVATGAQEATAVAVVAGIDAVLDRAPPPGLFADPPFLIERPGAYEADGHVRFVLHAPRAARAQLLGGWAAQDEGPVEMRLTRDGTYWWAQVPLGDLHATDHHGLRYRYRLDDRTDVVDPAAGWVDRGPTGPTARLVRQDRFRWTDEGWTTPGFEYLITYQVHPARFSARGGDGLTPFQRVAREIDDDAGYLRALGVTAVLLMPVNEVASHGSWGYDPAFFYAVEDSYGGPDGLKALVDACHRNGLAVLVDLVFNHAGTDGNILWSVARDTFFDGDTAWGAMVNFDDPRCRHFFEQNVVYLQRHFHLDGFRFDHTHTIVHSDQRTAFVRVPGSGGGWEFLHGLRRALAEAGASRCLLSAEHLPNEWAVTNRGGPMDSQWCDDFHDVLLRACRGEPVADGLAAALRLSHDACDDWYGVVNYPESHDEVGNTDDRIAGDAGFGWGLRASKVAAAATLLSRGLPMWFMGAESAEHRQFHFGRDTVLDLDDYEASPARTLVRAWWRALTDVRRHDDLVKGPSPLRVHHAHGHVLAFSRGDGGELFVALNFDHRSHPLTLASLGLPERTYLELQNSTWPAYAVEGEREHANGGHRARLGPSSGVTLPEMGVLVLRAA